MVQRPAGAANRVCGWRVSIVQKPPQLLKIQTEELSWLPVNLYVLLHFSLRLPVLIYGVEKLDYETGTVVWLTWADGHKVKMKWNEAQALLRHWGGVAFSPWGKQGKRSLWRELMVRLWLPVLLTVAQLGLIWHQHRKLQRRKSHGALYFTVSVVLLGFFSNYSLLSAVSHAVWDLIVQPETLICSLLAFAARTAIKITAAWLKTKAFSKWAIVKSEGQLNLHVCISLPGVLFRMASLSLSKS